MNLNDYIEFEMIYLVMQQKHIKRAGFLPDGQELH